MFYEADEEIAEGAGTGELDVTVGIDFLGIGGGDGGTVVIDDTFGDGDDAATEAVDDLADLFWEEADIEGAFGEVDEVGAVIEALACEGGGGGEEAGVTAHHDVNFDTWEGAVIEVIALEGFGDEAGGGGVSWGVVIFAQIVIDGFWDMEAVEFVAVIFCGFVDDVRGFGGIVPADIEEVADVMGTEAVEDGVAIVEGGFFTNGAECGGGGTGDQFEVLGCFAGEVDEVIAEDTVNAVAGAVNFFNFGIFSCFEDCADEALVNDDGGAAGLSDEHITDNFSTHGGVLFSGGVLVWGRG